MQQVQQMQQQMQQAQEELANETVTASAGGGAVRATMTGGVHDTSTAELAVTLEHQRDDFHASDFEGRLVRDFEVTFVMDLNAPAGKPAVSK